MLPPPKLSSLAAALLGFLILCPRTLGQGGANLLRNGNFQDDWLTLVPGTKNHHWCYASEFYNRHNFNPDCWWCKGSWQWLDADAPYGQRRLVLKGPTPS